MIRWRRMLVSMQKGSIMELDELDKLKAEGEQLIEAILNSKDDESQVISKAIRLLFLQERFLGAAIEHLQSASIKLQESHLALMDRVEKLEGEQ